MRWTCVEPLKKWRLDVEPNDSGIEWELYYEPTAPMWELLPMKVRDKDGRMLADMYHMKEPGRWTGWVQIDGERISVDGFHGGRDRTFGVRVSDKIDFWLWLDAGFEDRAIEAWIIESSDGTVNYVDGGITHNDGTLSKRFVKIEHDVEFDGDRKRPARAVLVFTDEDGKTYRVTADAPHQDVNAYYGLPMAHCSIQDLGDGAYFIHFQWDSNDPEQLGETEGKSMALDQLMRFELDGPTSVGASSNCCSAARVTAATRTGRRWTCRPSLRTRRRSSGCPPTRGSAVNDAGRQRRRASDRLAAHPTARRRRCPHRGARPGRLRALRRDDGADHRDAPVTRNPQDVVLRLRPKPPALLEPYDLARQFTILRALQDTDGAGATGAVARGHRRGPRPAVLRHGTRRRRRLRNGGAQPPTTTPWCGCAESLAEQLAAIHAVDLEQTGLDALDDGGGHLDRELDHWAAEMDRVKRGPLPALERLLAGAARQQARALPEDHPGAR